MWKPGRARCFLPSHNLIARLHGMNCCPQIVSQAAQPVLQQQQQQPPWAGAWAGPWQQQQQQAMFQQQPMHPQGSFASSAPVPMQQQWSNMPHGFPILVPGPGGSLVPAGSMPPDGVPPQQQPQAQAQGLQQQQQQQEEDLQEGMEDEIPEELPAAAAPAPLSKMTRVPTKRFVIGGPAPAGKTNNGEWTPRRMGHLHIGKASQDFPEP